MLARGVDGAVGWDGGMHPARPISIECLWVFVFVLVGGGWYWCWDRVVVWT